MHTFIEKLRQLQDILAEKHNIEHRLQELPKQLTTKNEVITYLKKNFLQKEELLNFSETQVKTLRIHLTSVQSLRENSEKRMAIIKTQREFELLEKEIQDTIVEEERLRREMNKEQKNLDDLKKEIDIDRNLIQLQEEELKNAYKDLDSTSHEEKNSLIELQKKEFDLSNGMPSDLIYKFETIVRNKVGLGIVPLRGGICRGCFIVLPAQFVNNVRSENKVEFCPSCSRVLFYEKSDENFAHIMFEGEDLGGLNELLDDEDAEDEDPTLAYSELSGEFEDN